MTTFYIKKGRRYVPVSEYDSDLMDAYPYGTHLVVVKPGSTSRKYTIDPAFAPMIAAGEFARDRMCTALHEASQARPKSPIATEEQQKAWKQLQTAFGAQLFFLEYPSMNEVAEAGIKAMQEEAEKMLENPAVRKAYERFLMVYELAKDHTNEVA